MNDMQVTRVPYEVWTRCLAELGITFEVLVRHLPKGIVLMPEASELNTALGEVYATRSW